MQRPPPPPALGRVLGPQACQPLCPTTLWKEKPPSCPFRRILKIGAVDLTAFGEAAKALFSTADTPEEVAAMRDEVLRRIAECAAATRQSIAESERTPHDE